MSDLPQSFRAGDTVTWTVTLRDYPASAGWTLTYSLLHASASKLTLTASASNDDFVVTIPAATSANYTAGDYTYVARVSKAGESYTVDSGRISILPNLATSTTYDGRSWAERVLTALEATLEGRATGVELELEIAGRRIRYFTPDELIKWHGFYKAEVVRERSTDRLRRGLGGPQKVLVRL